MESKLVGYVRRSGNGRAIKLSIGVEAFNEAERYKGVDGTEFVGLVINADKLRLLLNEDRNVVSVCQEKE